MQVQLFRARPVALAAALAVASTASLAQTAAASSTDGLKLDQVVITGTSTALPKMKQSVSVSTLDADQMEKTGATSAAELLRSIPGVRSESSGGEGNANITVRGVPLNHLVGRRFQVGEVILRGGRLNFPCKYLEKLLDMPVFLPLYNRSGLNCSIERGGVIRPGDAVLPL